MRGCQIRKVEINVMSLCKIGSRASVSVFVVLGSWLGLLALRMKKERSKEVRSEVFIDKSRG